MWRETNSFKAISSITTAVMLNFVMVIAGGCGGVEAGFAEGNKADLESTVISTEYELQLAANGGTDHLQLSNGFTGAKSRLKIILGNSGLEAQVVGSSVADGKSPIPMPECDYAWPNLQGEIPVALPASADIIDIDFRNRSKSDVVATVIVRQEKLDCDLEADWCDEVDDWEKEFSGDTASVCLSA